MSKHYLIILIFLSFISVSLTAQTIYTIDKKEIIILNAQDSLFSNMKYLGVAESYSPWENDTNVFSIQMTRMLRRVVKKKGNVVQITKCVNFDISGKFYFAENFDSLKSAIELNANKFGSFKYKEKQKQLSIGLNLSHFYKMLKTIKKTLFMT